MTKLVPQALAPRAQLRWEVPKGRVAPSNWVTSPAEPKGSLAPGRPGAGLQLPPQVADEVARTDLEPGRPRDAPQRQHQVAVGQGAGVVQVERLAVLAAQVCPCPVGGGPQPARRPPVVQLPGGQRQLDGAELHVVLPESSG